MAFYRRCMAGGKRIASLLTLWLVLSVSVLPAQCFFSFWSELIFILFILAQTKNFGSDSSTHYAELNRIRVLLSVLQTAFRHIFTWTEIIFATTIQFSSCPIGVDKIELEN